MPSDATRLAPDIVQRAVDEAVTERGGIGVQVAAYRHGELIVDTWAGVADQATGAAVDGDTLFNVFSVTKGITATAVHLQAERGLIDYDAPMAAYWPEFGANGKAAVTVRNALTHCTGAPQMPPGVTPEMMCDWDRMAAAIAALPPILPIGEPAYQSISFGWVLGELVRRTDVRQRSFRDFVAQDIAAPYGIDDLWIGIDPAVEPRIARLVDGMAMGALPEGSLIAQSMPPAVALGPQVFERPEVRRATIAGVGGIFTARAAARFFAILANGGELDGRRLLSRERVAMMCRPRPGADRPDPVFYGSVMPISEGGYWRYDPKTPSTAPVGSPTAICAPGVGGALAWADPATGLAVAFCHNHMTSARSAEAHPAYAIANAIRSSLGL
ncbi:MAG: serine hydrolase domain-containing protein [Rhizorhabdus sp.]